MWRYLIFLPMVAVAGYAAADESTFGGGGQRLKPHEKGFTIAEWIDQAKSARSAQFRLGAVTTMVEIVIQNTQLGEKLADSETAQCRDFGKLLVNAKAPPVSQMAAFDEYRQRREKGIRLLARIPDKSCVPIFVGVINKPSIREPGLIGPAFEGLERCGEDGRKAIEEIYKKPRSPTAKQLAGQALDRLDSQKARGK